MDIKSPIMMRFLRCHICSKSLVDPVSLNCNHSFCQSCLNQYLNQAECRDCAVCKKELPKETPGINFALKELADAFAGRTQFDEIKNQDVVCRKHPKTPSWFCVDEGTAVCEECQHSLQHSGHMLKRVSEVVESMKERLQSKLERMEQQLDLCIYADEVYKDIVQHMASQRAATETRVREEFEQLHQLLREEEEARLTTVREEEEEKKQRIDRELDIIQGQMLTLENSIHQIEKDLKQDSLAFLKGSKHTANRAQCILQDPQVFSGALLDVTKHLGNLKHRVCGALQEKVQYTPMVLDPNSAAGWLVLSDDLTSVRYMKAKQDLPDNPERFMEHAIVLGSEGFTSGKHRWEVDVGDRVKWVIGVARESVERKKDCFLKPQYGLWSIWKYNDEYHATRHKLSRQSLSLQDPPQRITVELDYEEGHVSFYDSRDMALLFQYQDHFTEKMFPYFNPQADANGPPLQICPSKGP
ncbi:nuclear factor 7, brain-like [Sardina pilchardus]|uniref:nuclear factor 7, brain-like n=1 Tax=Sardina pilchardus TaxID=27697 RepID=UPI002E166556